ncbi:MAG: DUF2835 family protein [Succinivibrionaceae bacterium]|nr:DUF2835 family protein [Succinivibrionaceae bacterium]
MDMFGPLKYRFSIHITKEQLLSIYAGAIQSVRVRTDSGLVLELAANHLKSFTTNEGISGTFELEIDRRTHKFISLRQLG